ncbi:Rv2175c family DNA-binding protein [Demequina sp. NBRC 110056]|uniref:Rv2175c family DNA-binding protein n=1 Tax=Demequina sp. NBRC 110056 TaxID=1570345 RepID=UPI001EEE2A23|nr:Rv2175c family DNA-binding protein [Demequina sp. NBRC 110056]
MTEQTAWLTVPDFADALGVAASDVREMIRQRQIIAVRRGPSDAWHVPAGFIHDHEGEVRVLPTLPGTITVLTDAGLSDDESIEWLLTENEELDTTPLAALREGRRAPVRRAAQTLF